MGWKIVEVNSDDYLRLYLNNLLIKRPSGRIMINLSDIDTLLISNYKITLTAQLINALTMNNVNIILINNKYEPQSQITPIQGHHGSLKIFEKQLNWNHVYKGKLWKLVVQNKIMNQVAHLKHINPTLSQITELEKLKDNVKNYDVSNREGHAAKLYWHAQYGLDFKRDYNAIQNSKTNSILNYGYAILRGMVIRSIVKKGLDPRISLFHKSVTNFFALGSDLMEPFRPIIDSIAYQNKDDNLFTIKVRDQLNWALTKKVIINGKKHYINNAIDIMVDHLCRQKEWSNIEIIFHDKESKKEEKADNEILI